MGLRAEGGAGLRERGAQLGAERRRVWVEAGLWVRTQVEVSVIGHEQGFGDEAHSASLPTHYLPADRGRTGACAAARAASVSRLAVNS